MPEGLFSPVHLIILFAILLLLFGAKKLPDLGKGIGTGIREFKTGISGLNDEPVEKQLPAGESAPAAQAVAPAQQAPVQAAAPVPQPVVQATAPAPAPVPQATVEATVAVPQATVQAAAPVAQATVQAAPAPAEAPAPVTEAPTTTE